jgi:membrane protein YdbS with pleckstrin-like domain
VGREYEYGGMVIRPPLERVSGGKVFKPSTRLRNKYWFEAIATALMLWAVSVGTFFGIIYGVFSLFENVNQWAVWWDTFWIPVNFWSLVIDLAWLVPTLILIPIYVNSFEYSVRAESGEASAEIYTKKGILTITRKHVPLRSITNVSTKFGVLDRLFGIGSVEIETAAARGIYEEGPVEKIAGITFAEELRDYILAEMRKFRAPNVLMTETESSIEEPVSRTRSMSNDEILDTLREMKDLLRSIDRKLDRRDG